MLTELNIEVKLNLNPRKLYTYNGAEIKFLGIINLKVIIDDKGMAIEMIVVPKGRNLLGTGFLKRYNESLNLSVCSIDTISFVNADEFLEFWRNKGLFRKVRAVKSFQAEIKLKDENKFLHLNHQMPIPLRLSLFKKLERLKTEKIIKPIRSSNCISPMVVVWKKDNTICICGGYRQLNNNIVDETFPFPSADELITTVKEGAEVFAKIDIKKAFLRLQLKSSDIEKTTILTPKGIYAFLRLPFGLKSSPVIFQKKIIDNTVI